jgi:GDP-mannose 6-dehydrogenase
MVIPSHRAAMKVAIFGFGYVGTMTAACLAEKGHDVWGVDVDPNKVDLVARGQSPIVEPGLADLVARTVGDGALHATMSVDDALEGADLSLVCVGTPSTSHGETDLSYVERAVTEIARSLRRATPPPGCFHTVVIRSTVPPGTVETLLVPILEAHLESTLGLDRSRFGVAFCPEFLREGSGYADFGDPPFTVVGTTDCRAADAISRLFWFLEKPIRVVDVGTAEALKYACNAFHATKVSFANEMGRVLRQLDVDARVVMELFCEDDRLNISRSYLRPSFAFGGSCLPKDLRALLHIARMNNVDLPLLNGTLLSNDLTVRDVVDRVLATDARQACLMGLSFKMETDDLRESPNVTLAETLVGKGLDVRIFDPVIKPARLVGANRAYSTSKLPHLNRLLAESPDEALAGADVAIVSSSEPAVVNGLLSSPPPHIIDLDGRLGSAVEALPGYSGVGW